MINPISWSHSSLKKYEQCAKQYYEVNVLKNYPFVETEATQYGNEFHKAAELYVRDGVPLPPQFLFIKPTIDALQLKPGRKLCEHKMALTKELNPCDWWDKKVWVRGMADWLSIDDDNLTAWVIDYKTGNNKYPDREQLRLMSMLVFAHFPHIRVVRSALLFVIKNSITKDTMTYDKAADEWWKYRERVARIEKAHETGVWNPKESALCPWCPVKTCAHHPEH